MTVEEIVILNEPNLIKWLKENYSDISFISTKLEYERHDRTQKLSDSLKNLDENKWLFDQERDTIKDLWRNLLGKAIVYLKSKDDRETFHDDEDYGVDKLDKFFETFSRFEPLLYGAEERYRDHMTHVLGVFLIGEYLIRNTIGFNMINVGDKEFPPGTVSADEKEAMWCVMSLAHDLGIALEKIPNINEKVAEMLKEFGLTDVQGISFPYICSPLDEFTVKFVSSDLRKSPGSTKEVPSFLTHTQLKYFLKFSESYERRDHGIVGCLVLMKNLVYFLETDYSLDDRKPLDLDDAKQFLIRRSILRAVASHSNNDIYYLKVNDFAFLLRIFDELHERERPTLTDLIKKKMIEPTVTAKLNAKELYCNVTFNWKGERSVKHDTEVLQKEIEGYFDSKCNIITQILRSALGGKERDLILTFEVCDYLGTKVNNYTIIHETPEKITIKRS